jgi:hypothetical protein
MKVNQNHFRLITFVIDQSATGLDSSTNRSFGDTGTSFFFFFFFMYNAMSFLAIVIYYSSIVKRNEQKQNDYIM